MAEGRKARPRRDFDWSKAEFSKYLLKFAYYGARYKGVASQTSTVADKNQAVEDVIFAALEKCCLIRSRDECEPSRAGRTDAGVHARANYLALFLREVREERNANENATDCTDTLPSYNWTKSVYMDRLNNILPWDVRIVDVHRVASDFDARFDCIGRWYKYIFAVTEDLDIELMGEAAKAFEGEHDFRNFCKFDANKAHHIRTIISFEVTPYGLDGGFGVADIKGSAFLWRQVRCMMGSLLEVARRRRDVGAIRAALAHTTGPAGHKFRSGRPIASADGLILYDCSFPASLGLSSWFPTNKKSGEVAPEAVHDYDDANGKTDPPAAARKISFSGGVERMSGRTGTASFLEELSRSRLKCIILDHLTAE